MHQCVTLLCFTSWFLFIYRYWNICALFILYFSFWKFSFEIFNFKNDKYYIYIHMYNNWYPMIRDFISMLIYIVFLNSLTVVFNFKTYYLSASIYIVPSSYKWSARKLCPVICRTWRNLRKASHPRSFSVYSSRFVRSSVVLHAWKYLKFITGCFLGCRQ